jgi:hypothetical protein
MDFPNGNDAPNSSGCPDGTGTAPRPCAAPGEAGCSPTIGPPIPGEYDTYYTQSQLTVLSFAGALMRWPSFGTALDFAYAEANSRPDAGVDPPELPPGGLDYGAGVEGGLLADPVMRAATGVAVDAMVLTVAAQGIVAGNAAKAAPTLSADQDLLAQFGPRVPTRSGGYFNVVTHSDANIAHILREGRWASVSHRSLAQFIQRSPGYTGGPVRLIGCNSGACTTGLAQNLSNKMGVEVLAPTGDVFIDSTGSFWTNGTWRAFTPGL